MKILSTYKIKISSPHGAFKNTVEQYRGAVGFFIKVVLAEWTHVSKIKSSLERQGAIEKFSHKTANNPFPKYNFDKDFYKFPSYLRRAAITEAIGKVSSYKSNYENWLRYKRVTSLAYQKLEEFILRCIVIIALSKLELTRQN